MNPTTKMIAIDGSLRNPVPGAKLIKDSDPSKKIKVSLYLRTNPNPPADLTGKVEDQSLLLPGKRKYLSDDEFKNLYGASAQDMDKVKAWVATKNLSVVSQNAEQRKIEVEGTIGDISNAFGVELKDYSDPELGHFRGRSGKVCIPEDLYGIVEGVFGLDTRPIGKPRRRRSSLAPVPWQNTTTQTVAKKAAKAQTGFPGPASPIKGAFFPTQVASLYDYPDTDGTGQNIAVFAFNGEISPDIQSDPRGGYDPQALENYYSKVLGQQVPTITDVVIAGPGNNPGPDTQASSNQGDSTGEIMLDLCIVGAAAPGAHIFVYFTEFNSKGWVDALSDAIGGNNNISVISISYGNSEKDPNSLWTLMEVQVVNTALQAAMAKGITICVSSGDDGAFDGGGKIAEVDFPASSPFVLAVGGTKLSASAGSSPTVKSETVWNEILHKEGASGGGISVVFSKPAYQESVNVPTSSTPPHFVGRGVPDVSAVGDPVTGVVVMHIDGKNLESIGGTSASAPLWACLVARINQSLGARCGFLNPLLYSKFAKGILRDITSGNNGLFQAQKGWDACTGLGSPGGKSLLNALSGKPKK
jgi:kumamolisin